MNNENKFQNDVFHILTHSNAIRTVVNRAAETSNIKEAGMNMSSRNVTEAENLEIETLSFQRAKITA